VLVNVILICVMTAVLNHVKIANFYAQLLTVLIFVAPAAYNMRREREPASSVGIGRHNLWQGCVIGLVAGALLGALFCCCRQSDVANKILNPSIGAWHFAHCSVVGFREEFFFRGYLQTRLIAWLGMWRGWILASVIMALAHIPSFCLTNGICGGILTTLVIIPVSLFLGFVMIRTQNLVAPLMAHAIADWV
jgi:membrane protease YdiL (CAAX protease family)